MTPLQLKNYLGRLGLAPAVRDEILEMVHSSPARKVGESALDNSVVRFQSGKNHAPRILESHAVGERRRRG